jgi:uncharacterized lipoprotein YmbA
MNRCVFLAPLALALGLGACASAPVQYYTLSAPSAYATTAEQPAAFLIDVLPVGVPAPLDQPQWVVRQGDSGIAVLDDQRWAGPLGDELRSALSVELTHRLDTQDIAGLARPAGKSTLRIKLQVRRFDAWPGQRVQLGADWSLGFADEADSAQLVCGGLFEQAAAGGSPELARAQQRMVAALAARIATDARRLSSSRGALCSGGLAGGRSL